MSSIDDYLAGLPPDQRAAFEQVRNVVRRVAPDAEQGVSYGMPAFLHRGRPLLGMRAAQRHLSIFPFSPAAIEEAADALAGLDVSKGTVRFSAAEPVSDTAVEALVRARLRELDAG
jgi:uncharacterized protein YdhG (YjbR/CyaY superfamily)